MAENIKYMQTWWSELDCKTPNTIGEYCRWGYFWTLNSIKNWPSSRQHAECRQFLAGGIPFPCKKYGPDATTYYNDGTLECCYTTAVAEQPEVANKLARSRTSRQVVSRQSDSGRR